MLDASPELRPLQLTPTIETNLHQNNIVQMGSPTLGYAHEEHPLKVVVEGSAVQPAGQLFFFLLVSCLSKANSLGFIGLSGKDTSGSALGPCE